MIWSRSQTKEQVEANGCKMPTPILQYFLSVRYSHNDENYGNHKQGVDKVTGNKSHPTKPQDQQNNDNYI